MKKLVAFAAVVAAVSFASCGNKSSETAEVVAAPAEEVAPAAADSTVAAPADSTAAVATEATPAE